MNYTYHKAGAEDLQTIYDLVRELAAYEKLSHEMVSTPDDLRKYMFSGDPKAHAILAEADGKPVGMCLYFYNFSTFIGKPGMYIEDLFVYPEYRGHGIGSGFFKYLSALAMEEDCGRIQWAVLDWNEPSIEFYKKMGAVMLDDWIVCRLEGKVIEDLAKS